MTITAAQYRAIAKVKPESEHTLQRAVAKYLDTVICEPWTWTSIDAGAGKLKPRTARQRKNRGVKKGWPDILILGPGPKLLGIELKAKGGDITDEQRDMERRFYACKAWHVTCRSVAEVDKALAFVRGHAA